MDAGEHNVMPMNKGSLSVLFIDDHQYLFTTRHHNFVSNNKQISENKAIANGFNNYFTNVGFNLAKNVSSPDKDVSIFDYLGE